VLVLSVVVTKSGSVEPEVALAIPVVVADEVESESPVTPVDVSDGSPVVELARTESEGL
jgi:hypothetical protein